MKAALIELIDFEKVNILLEGFNKTTGFVTAILDLDGNVLSKSGWRQMCTDFHRINPETSKKCTISDTELANNIADGKKYHFYKCLNGLVDVAVPIVINGEHIAYLFSGQFFFEEPDHTFFKKQAEKYGFDEKKYLEALAKVPVVTKEKVEVAMDFLLNMTQLISESTFQKLEQTILNKALKQSEERFQMLFNKAPLGYQSLDIDGHFIEVNQQWLDTLGYERDEVIGKWFGDFLTPMFQDGFRERFPIFKAQGHIHSEFEMVHKNGSILFIAFDGRVGNDTDGNFMQTHCILQDNTESKRVKEALLEAEWKFKALFELGPIGVAYHKMIYDEAGNPYDYYFIDANESYNELTGVNPNGMTVRQAFPGIENDPSDWIGMFGKVAKTGETIRFEQYLESNGRWYDCVGYQYKPDHFVAAFNEITKRKKAEIAMKASEEKFRNFFENTVVGKSITTIDGNLFVNNSFCQIVGYSEAELKNLNWRQITHKDDIELNENIVDIILNGEKKSERWEKRYIHKDGHIVWTDINTTLQRDDDGNPLYFITAIVDISDKKSTEASLRQSEEDFRNVIELSPVPMAIIHEWKTIYFNPAAVQLFGAKSQSEILDKHIYEFIHPDFQDLAIKNSIILAEKGYVDMQEQKYIKLDGSILDVEVQAKSIQFNNDHATLIVINDITERKIAEKTLKKSEERYSSLLLHLETGIVVHAADTSIIMSNPRASDLLGISNDQMIGKTAIDPEWKFIDIENKPMLVDEYPVQRILNTKQAIRDQILGIQQSVKSDIVWVKVNGFPVLNSLDEITEIVISFNDITERKKAEALLENERSLYLDLVNTQPAGIYRIRVFAKENWGEDAWKKADNPPFKMELISDRFCEILDINPQSLELHPGIIIDLVHPADKEEFIRRNDEANTLVSNFKWDCRIVIKDKIKWIHFESLPRKLENGDILFTGIIYDITEQKIAQEKLQDSEMRFRKILQDVESLSVQGYAPDGTTQYWNKASERLYGYTAEEAIGKNFTDLIIPSEMREGVKQIIKQMAETGQAIPASELSLLRKDGSLVTVFSNHTIVQIAGQPQELFCIDIDLTELKKAEEALKKNQKMLADTETIGKVGGWEFNMDTFEQIWTEETYEIHELHYDFEATVENGINFYTPESLPIIQNAVNLAVEKGEPFDLELEIITAKGNRKFVHTIGKTDMEGRRVYGFFQDITERKNAEQALKESEEKLSTLFSSMTEMVVMHELVLDENGEAVNYIIIDCNKAFTDITGIKKKEAVGMLATKLYASTTAPYLKEYATVCATGKPLEFNTYFAPMEKHFLISVVFIGKNRFSTISTDITSNEQIHAIIKEKNKELENYIYVASHDLRSPLVNIQGFSQRLQKQTSQLTKVISEINLNTELASEFSKITTVEIPKSLDFILNNVSKMDTLINGLLQLSRTGQIKINVNNVNMNNLFRKIIAAFNFQLSEYGAEVKIHKIIDCYGDENQLNQLFSNIISNAIKYRDKNRKLTIEISSIILYNKVIYNIKDTGIGMNQRHLERIWDVFYRVDASAAEAGEGLGLSLAKRIVDKHKGKIWAESVEGVGSTFFVELHRNNFEV